MVADGSTSDEDAARPLRFLWLTRESPLQPDRGDMVYSNGILRALLTAGGRGVMIAYARPGQTDPVVDGLEVRLCPSPQKSRALSLFTPLPSEAYRNSGAAFETALTRALDQGVDAIVIDYYAMGWVLPLIRTHPSMRGPMRPALVYLSHQDEQSLRPRVAKSVGGSLPMRAVLLLDAIKGARLDKALSAAADIVTAITEEDRRTFLSRAPGKTVVALTPGYDGEVSVDPQPSATRPRRVILLGGLIWIAKRKNLIDFLEVADPVFRHAGVELFVVGHAATDFMKSTAARFGCVRFEGPVDDLAPVLDSARIGVMPDTLGAGFKMKYLDYIFHGLPVATIRSEAVGLPLDIDRDMIAADTPLDLAHAIVESIDDTDRLDGMSRRALAACRPAFAWDDRGRTLYSAIQSNQGRRFCKPAADRR